MRCPSPLQAGGSSHSFFPSLFLAATSVSRNNAPDNVLLFSAFFSCKRGVGIQRLSFGSETIHMTSEGLGEMLEGDFADIWADNWV